MKKIVVGILAHVDSGKTTLSEAMLYHSGAISKLGRVDSKNSFLDTFSLERSRGITIFSKQALLKYKETDITLIDTPGHVDFSAETERTLQVLDYAILVISATDGVQSHTQTLWKLLAKYKVPCFIFVNKTDLDGADKDVVLYQLKSKLSDGCVDFTLPDDELNENIALCDDVILEKYEPFKIFVNADIDARVNRCIERAKEGEDTNPKEVRKKILGIDKTRARSREILSDGEWGSPELYDLCVNTTNRNIKQLTKALKEYIHCLYPEIKEK